MSVENGGRLRRPTEGDNLETIGISRLLLLRLRVRHRVPGELAIIKRAEFNQGNGVVCLRQSTAVSHRYPLDVALETQEDTIPI